MCFAGLGAFQESPSYWRFFTMATLASQLNTNSAKGDMLPYLLVELHQVMELGQLSGLVA